MTIKRGLMQQLILVEAGAGPRAEGCWEPAGSAAAVAAGADEINDRVTDNYFILLQNSLPQIRYLFHCRGPFRPRLRMCRIKYSCDTFDKLFLASMGIIHRCPQNSRFY